MILNVLFCTALFWLSCWIVGSYIDQPRLDVAADLVPPLHSTPDTFPEIKSCIAEKNFSACNASKKNDRLMSLFWWNYKKGMKFYALFLIYSDWSSFDFIAFIYISPTINWSAFIKMLYIQLAESRTDFTDTFFCHRDLLKSLNCWENSHKDLLQKIGVSLT